MHDDFFKYVNNHHHKKEEILLNAARVLISSFMISGGKIFTSYFLSTKGWAIWFGVFFSVLVFSPECFLRAHLLAELPRFFPSVFQAKYSKLAIKDLCTLTLVFNRVCRVLIRQGDNGCFNALSSSLFKKQSDQKYYLIT